MKNKINIVIFSILFSIVIWVSVTLSEQYFSTVNLDIKVINQPEGYTCGLLNPQDVQVKIKAKGWQILSYYIGKQKDFSISANNDSGKITIDPNKEIGENIWLSSSMNILEIIPRSISFRVEKLVYKKLKVEANTSTSFSEGYGLATPIKVYPDSIIVSGPSSSLSEKTSIKTKFVSFKSLDNKIKINSEVEELNGFTLEKNYVQILLDVQRIVEKPFDKIKVIINDIPRDHNVVLMPNTIDCSLRGGINILGKINNDQISASVNYNDIVNDTLGYVLPKITVPKNTQLIFIKPARLNYIIKKFE